MSWVWGLVLVASACATSPTHQPRRAVSIVSVTASAGDTPVDDDLARQLRGWEQHAEDWLRDRLVSRGYRVAQRFDPGGTIMWSLRIDVVPGDREVRAASLGADGHGAVKVTLTATAWGSDRFQATAERTTQGQTYGMGLGRVLDAALGEIVVPQASSFDEGPAAAAAR